MQDLREALADIDTIRAQMARNTQFHGYGPRSIAATGVLAVAVAEAQSIFLPGAGHYSADFLTLWCATAVIALALSAWETVSRTRRLHAGIGRQMMQSALEQFLPPLVVGLLLTVVLVHAAPDEVWMLPGLWEIAFSLGIFASCRFLPRPLFAVGLWYLVCGLMCLSMDSGSRTLSPWALGIPFGIGQLLVAAVLKHDYSRSTARGPERIV